MKPEVTMRRCTISLQHVKQDILYLNMILYQSKKRETEDFSSTLQHLYIFTIAQRLLESFGQACLCSDVNIFSRRDDTTDRRFEISNQKDDTRNTSSVAEQTEKPECSARRLKGLGVRS